jgi:hypothetical protein
VRSHGLLVHAVPAAQLGQPGTSQVGLHQVVDLRWLQFPVRLG